MSALGPWIDIPGLGERVNGLLRQSWALIDEAETLDDPEDAADLWEEAEALETRIQRQREIDTNRGRHAQG